MNIVVICKREDYLFFGTENGPQDSTGLKIKFFSGNSDSEPHFLKISTEADFERACPSQKNTGKSKRKQKTLTINGFFNSGDPNENQVFIVPEDWELGSVNKGYEMARKLLKSVGKKKPFNLRFVSRYPREQLLTEVKKENKALVETIPHLFLFGHVDHEVTIPPEAYSTAHFRLIRDIVISDSGHLSLIEHEVKNIVENKLDDEHLKETIERFQRHVFKILDDLDCSAYTGCYVDCKKVLQDLHVKANSITAVVSTDDFKNASTKLQNEIVQLINKINRSLPHDEDSQEAQTYEKKNYRVLIIEDHRDQRNSLYQFFNSHYEFVACNDVAETLSNLDYEEWKIQLVTTYCSVETERIKTVEQMVDSLKSNSALTKEDFKLWDKQLKKIQLELGNKNLEKQIKKFPKIVKALSNKKTFSKEELEPLNIVLTSILEELNQLLYDKTEKIKTTIETVTLKNHDQAVAWYKNIQEIGSMFDIVILDLLLKDQNNQTWLPFNGIDLLCSIRKNIPFNTVRIITSLPRHEIGNILKEENIEVPMNQIFTKGNGLPQLEGCLYDRLDEINTECKKNEAKRRENQHICMPNKGDFFKHAEVREYAQTLMANKTFHDVIEQAKSMVAPDNTRPPIQLMRKGSFDKTKISELFLHHLAHRFAFLDWAATENNVLTMKEINFTSYGEEASRHHIDITITANYFNRLGFSASDETNCVNLDAAHMFPEELDYYIEKITKVPSIEKTPLSIKKWCIGIIRPVMYKYPNIRNSVKFTAFSMALDTKMRNFRIKDHLFGLLDECITYSNITDDSNIKYKDYREVLKQICQQEWFRKDMCNVIKVLKKREENNKSLPKISPVLESYYLKQQQPE